MAGRNPKPTGLRELEGNRGHRPLNKDEPKPEFGAPPMPKGLSKLARKKWKETVPHLLRMKVLYKSDGDALGNYCRAYAILQSALADIEKHGATFAQYATDPLGQLLKDKAGDFIVIGVKTNPAVTIADKMIKLMRAIGGDFGLSPVSRPKLHVGNNGGEPEDPMGDFLRRKASSAATQ